MKKPAIIVMSIAVLIISLAPAQAYGPSIHLREADRYITLLETTPLPGPDHNPSLLRANRWELRLGSIWPDLARVVIDRSKVDQGLNDPHNRHLNRFILQDALAQYPQDPWKVAFAVGCLLHNTGDLVAQTMLTEHMAVRGRLGELDVFVGAFDDHPGGENEGLLEGGLEFMQPDFRMYTSMASHFFFSTAGFDRLTDAYNYYLTKWEEFFGSAMVADADAAFDDLVTALLYPIAGAFGETEPMFFDPNNDFDDFALAAVSIDFAELFRVLSGPVSTDEFWNIYYSEGYFDLSPHIMLGFQAGQGYFDYFPNWSSKMMKSGSMQALNYYLPGIMAEEDGRFVMDLYWTNDDTGSTITNIDAASLPSSVTVTVVFYDVPGRTNTEDIVTLRIREDGPGNIVAAFDSADVGIDPWTYDVNVPQSLSVSFDPAPSVGNGAAGFFAEAALGANPSEPPFFTTDWEPYAGITQVDMTKVVYTGQYSTYGHWPYSLKVNDTAKGQKRINMNQSGSIRGFARLK